MGMTTIDMADPTIMAILMVVDGVVGEADGVDGVVPGTIGAPHPPEEGTVPLVGLAHPDTVRPEGDGHNLRELNSSRK